LDADGLNACAGATELFKRRLAPTVLTPHIGEFVRLSCLSKEEILANPLAVSRRFAQDHQVILVLKGAPAVVAWPDGRVAVNTTGNPGMATAGAGDVLTGLVAGFIAQGMGVDRAVALAVFAHGAAGDRARDRLGEWSVMAGDIVAEVPGALLELAGL
jgi:ADP-dependent NAD(P)H-hydrate dehydratase / NAD(P)H-hydrate epimerase